MQAMTILVLEDERRLLDELSEYLESNGFRVFGAASPSKAMYIVQSQPIDIAIIDIKLPEYSGIDFLERLKDEKPEVEAIVMSGHGDMDTVIQAMRSGAFDFLQKPFKPIDIKIAIERTSKYVLLQEHAHNLRTACSALQKEILSIGGVRLIGVSPAVRKTAELVDAAAENPDTPVLITGESGTGKELVARLIHLKSRRSAEPFVPVNCAAVSQQLIESEFFGHRKGAFTDAQDKRKGFFRSADKGTLFLDEIGDMPYELQTKLLRVIEEKSIRPVGSDEEIPVDVRILCATNRRLDDLIREKKFRLDLYHRISVFDINIPPLRERIEDIPVLAEYFLENFSRDMGKPALKLSEEDIHALQAYEYPGNIRELKNILEKAVILGRAPAVADSPCAPLGGGAPADSDLPTLNLEELERLAVVCALKSCRGNMSKAAGMLGLSRQALDRRMLKYGLKNEEE